MLVGSRTGVRRLAWMTVRGCVAATFLLCGIATPAQASVKTVPDTRVPRHTHPGGSRDVSRGSAIISTSGCETNALPQNDDGSTDEIELPFALNFFGQEYSNLWVNNNGNVTFTGPLSTYTPFEITASTPPIIAPFLADVDTRGEGSGLVTYGTTTYEGRPAFCVNWPNVGYYEEHTDKLNSFQLLLVNRADVAPGDFDIVFDYDTVQWETGDASDGFEGFGGVAPTVGFSNGDGVAAHTFQLAGSLENGAFLDANDETGLIHRSYGSPAPGRYVFHVTGTQGASGGGDFSRPWPSAGYGYSFANRGLPGYLIPAGLAPAQVFTPSGLGRTFVDWARDAAASGGEARAVTNLMRTTVNGVCFGLALSGGRFDAEEEPISDPGMGRTDPEWIAAGSGPSASMRLSAPGAPFTTASFNEQFLGLIGDDFVTQYSTEVNTSLQLQHYAYADPTTGVTHLQSELESVLGTGHNLYDPSGRLSGARGTNFAPITLQTLEPGHHVGHEVLAYSLEVAPSGRLQIDVWDNNFPGHPYSIFVEPDGTWTYDAPYSGSTFTGTYSLTGAPGYTLGLLAVLPLFDPTGLHYYPSATGGLGSGVLVDVPPEDEVAEATDADGRAIDVEPAPADEPGASNGEVIDLPSSAGSLQVTGNDPGADIRGEHAYMTAQEEGASSPLQIVTDDSAGSVLASGAPVKLSVARGSRVLSTTGAGGLSVAPDGTVVTTKDSGTLTVELEYAWGEGVAKTTLFEGPVTEATTTFPASEVAAAEASPGSGGTESGGAGSGGQGVQSSGSNSSANAGSVLSSHQSQVGTRAIRLALLRALSATSHGVRAATVRKHANRMIQVNLAVPGKIVLSWWLPPGHGKGPEVLVARGTSHLSGTGLGTVKLALTAAGRRLFTHQRGVHLIARGTFTRAGSAPLSVQLGFSLK